jgi:hypothetical protein
MRQPFVADGGLECAASRPRRAACCARAPCRRPVRRLLMIHQTVAADRRRCRAVDAIFPDLGGGDLGLRQQVRDGGRRRAKMCQLCAGPFVTGLVV